MDARTAHGDTPAAETPNGRVVVGVDGSDASLRALDQAALEAQCHGARLEIVYGWPWRPSPPAPASMLRGWMW
jgi:nucleotide-binding universal stress UspA family protein